MARRYGKRKPFFKKEELERLNGIIETNKDEIEGWKEYIKFAKADIRFYEKEIADCMKIIKESKKEKRQLDKRKH